MKKVLTPVPFPAYLGLKAEEGKGSHPEGFCRFSSYKHQIEVF